VASPCQGDLTSFQVYSVSLWLKVMFGLGCQLQSTEKRICETKHTGFGLFSSS
jgi:hypothetical protein